MTPALHVHQGGTVRTYCGRPLTPATVAVSWEDAKHATCYPCTARMGSDS